MYCTTNYPIPYELWIYVIDMMEQPELELFFTNKEFFSLLKYVDIKVVKSYYKRKKCKKYFGTYETIDTHFFDKHKIKHDFLFHGKPKIISFNIVKYAIKKGHINILRYIDVLVKNKNELVFLKSFKYPKITKCLQNSCKYSHMKLIDFYIDKGADVSAENSLCLKKAAEYGHLIVVKYLVDLGVDIIAKEPERIYIKENYGKIVDNYALIMAAKNGHLDVVSYLVEKGANPKSSKDYGMRLAAKYGHYEVVKFLVENGCNANCDRAIIWCCEENHLEILKYLVSKGANIFPDTRNDEDSAIARACAFGRTEIVEYLVGLGVNITDHNYNLVACAISSKNFDLVYYLVDHGANIQTYDHLAIIWASELGFIDMVKYLITKGENIHCRNNYSIKRAISRKKVDMIRYILSIGTFDKQDVSELIKHAEKYRYSEIVNELKIFCLELTNKP